LSYKMALIFDLFEKNTALVKGAQPWVSLILGILLLKAF
jgi:hypothetical protein